MADDWIGIKKGKVVAVYCSHPWHRGWIYDITHRACGKIRFGRCESVEGYRVRYEGKEKDIWVVQFRPDIQKRKRRNRRKRRERKKSEKALLE